MLIGYKAVEVKLVMLLFMGDVWIDFKIVLPTFKALKGFDRKYILDFFLTNEIC